MELDRWGLSIIGRSWSGREGNYVRPEVPWPHQDLHCIMNSIPMMDTLKRRLWTGVRIVERVMVTEFIRSKGRVVGALGFNPQSAKPISSRQGCHLRRPQCGIQECLHGGTRTDRRLLAAACRIGVTVQNMENVCSNTCARHMDIMASTCSSMWEES